MEEGLKPHSPFGAIFKRKELMCFVLSCVLPITMYINPQKNWISVSAPTSGKQPNPWVLVNSFHGQKTLVFIFRPLHELCRGCFLLIFHLNALLLPSEHSGLRLLETWLSTAWYMGQDSVGPREQAGCAVCRRPSGREAQLSAPAELLRPERGPSERAAGTQSAAVSRVRQQRFYLILLSSLGTLTASGSSELSLCLFRRCLPFCFEVWHPLCYPKLGHCVKIQWNF